MKRPIKLAHRFVDAIPEAIEERTLYISIEYATAVHKCCCGCCREVVTPLSPTDWKLTYDGVSVSLYPSIGNWGFNCRSHYWIRNSAVSWAEAWSKREIEAGRSYDRRAKGEYFSDEEPAGPEPAGGRSPDGEALRQDLWSRLRKWWLRQ